MVWLAIPVMVLDLTASDGGLVEGGMTGQWAWGTPTVGPVGLGACWETNLDGDYLHDTVDTLEVPLPDLTGLTRPVVVLQHWYDVAPGDSALVQVDAGSGFAVLTPVQGYPDPGGFVGASGGYVDHAFDLSGLGATPRFRLTLAADAAVADAGWALQRVVLWDGDVVPPVIAPVTTPTDTQDLDGPYDVLVSVTDDVAVADVVLEWTAGGGPTQVQSMVPLGGGLYRGQIDGQGPDTRLEWWVQADDGEQSSTWPPAGTEAFRVFLGAPTDLEGPAGAHLIGSRVELGWTAPVSPHPVVAYHVFQDGQAEPVVVTTEAATVVLDPRDTQVFEVRAQYDAGLGDASEPLALSVEVPDLADVDPTRAYQGDELYLQLTGSSLYLLQGESTLDLGPDVRVLDLDVRDANAATARISVEPDAAIGPVDISVVGTAGRFDFDDRFEIRPGDDAPRILRISPASMKQGDEVVVEIEATEPFAGPVVVDGGEDLFVTGAVEVDAERVVFPLAASTRSRIGRHTLVLDDGARLWPVDVQVDEYIASYDGGCSTAGAAWTNSLPWVLRRR